MIFSFNEHHITGGTRADGNDSLRFCSICVSSVYCGRELGVVSRVADGHDNRPGPLCPRCMERWEKWVTERAIAEYLQSVLFREVENLYSIDFNFNNLSTCRYYFYTLIILICIYIFIPSNQDLYIRIVVCKWYFTCIWS